MKTLTLVIIILVTTLALNAQVAINTDGTAADNSAMLDVKSNTAGILIPRMTSTQRQAISSPAIGLLVYDTEIGTFMYYKSSGWEDIRHGNIAMLSDNDNDTKIDVDSIPLLIGDK